MNRLILPFLLCINFCLSNIYATDVSGPTFSNTVWNEAGSPYNLTGDFQIPSGVTLTIEENVIVNFNSDYEILIKGAININGTANNKVVFNGNSSGSAMLMFKSANLNNSIISYVEFIGPKHAIQLAEETEHNQDDKKNTGTLNIDNITVDNSKIQTNGYASTASLQITNSNFTNSIIRGDYPRSEKLTLVDCTFDNCTIESDAYNYGLEIKGGTVSNSSLLVGYCDAYITIENATIKNTTANESDSHSNSPVNIYNCIVNELDINLPYGEVNIEHSEITNNSSTIKYGFGNFKYSKLSGNGTNSGLEHTGKSGWNSGGASILVSAEITNFNIGLKVTDCTSLSISNSNIYSNTSYNVYNNSSKNITAEKNYWGETSIPLIRNKIYDYYKDINYGKVIINQFASVPYNTDTPTSNETLSANTKIELYPNPVSDYLRVNTETMNTLNYQLISNSGQVFKSGTIDKNNLIDFSGLPSGIYIVTLRNEELTYSTKVIKK